MNNVNIIAFGRIAEVVGKASLELNVADVDELQQVLWTRFPEMKDLKYRIAVNKQLITANVPLPSNAEVALLPPFSGG